MRFFIFFWIFSWESTAMVRGSSQDLPGLPRQFLRKAGHQFLNENIVRFLFLVWKMIWWKTAAESRACKFHKKMNMYKKAQTQHRNKDNSISQITTVPLHMMRIHSSRVKGLRFFPAVTPPLAGDTPRWTTSWRCTTSQGELPRLATVPASAIATPIQVVTSL